MVQNLPPILTRKLYKIQRTTIFRQNKQQKNINPEEKETGEVSPTTIQVSCMAVFPTLQHIQSPASQGDKTETAFQEGQGD